MLTSLGLLSVLLVINRVKYNYPSWRKLSIMLLSGIIIGMALDYVLGYKAGLWYYVHHEWYTFDYFYYLIPAWGMVLTIFILFYSLLVNSIDNINIRLGVYFVVICGQQEFMGIWRHSWEYNAPLWLILVGWILLLEVCILIKHYLDWINEPSYTITNYNLIKK